MGRPDKTISFAESEPLAGGAIRGLERLSGRWSRLIPAEQYYSPEFARLERERFWSKVWVVAGRVEDLEEPGDYFTFELADQPLLIVRTDADRVKAYYNVCQHRGNKLVADGEGSLPGGFTCPFHSWKWNLDGSLREVTDRETFRPEVLCGDLDLAEVRCEVWGGFVFVCQSPDAPPVREFLSGAREHAEPYRIENMRVITDIELNLPANWKTGVDAFIEAYHLHAIHPQMADSIDDVNVDVELYDHGMSLMTAPFTTISPRKADQETLTAAQQAMLVEAGLDPAEFEGRAQEVRTAIQQAKRALKEASKLHFDNFTDDQLTDDQAIFFFPNLAFNVHPEGALFMQFLPYATDPERMIFRIQILIHPLDQQDAHLIPLYMGIPKGADVSCREKPEKLHALPPADESPLGEVLGQDVSLLHTVQKGLHAAGFKGMRFSQQEVRLRHFHDEFDRYMNSDPSRGN